MHTTPNTVDSARPDTRALEEQLRAERHLTELTMQRVQRTALDTLEELMAPPTPTGNAKQDAIDARERNRRRLAATQALLHCRTMAREARVRREARRKARAKAEREATSSQKANAKLPTIPTEAGKTLAASLIAAAGSLSSAAQPPSPSTAPTPPDPGPASEAAPGSMPEPPRKKPYRRIVAPVPPRHC